MSKAGPGMANVVNEQVQWVKQAGQQPIAENCGQFLTFITLLTMIFDIYHSVNYGYNIFRSMKSDTN